MTTLPRFIVLLSCLPIVAQAASTEPAVTKAPHIVLVGDSTVAPNSGWGNRFAECTIGGATVTNFGKGGRSSKSFIDEGHWAKALALKGDYYLIQFGHNDQPGKGPARETDPATTFPANIARYVDDVRAIGGTPVLVTSLTRRIFSNTDPTHIESTLTPYAEAVKKVATEKHVPLIDLHARSLALCEKIGPAETAKLNPLKPDGTADTTHLGPVGAAVFVHLIIEDLTQAVPTLAPFLCEPAPKNTSERGTGEEDGAQEPAKQAGAKNKGS